MLACTRALALLLHWACPGHSIWRQRLPGILPNPPAHSACPAGYQLGVPPPAGAAAALPCHAALPAGPQLSPAFPAGRHCWCQAVNGVQAEEGEQFQQPGHQRGHAKTSAESTSQPCGSRIGRDMSRADTDPKPSLPSCLTSSALMSRGNWASPAAPWKTGASS